VAVGAHDEQADGLVLTVAAERDLDLPLSVVRRGGVEAVRLAGLGGLVERFALSGALLSDDDEMAGQTSEEEAAGCEVHRRAGNWGLPQSVPTSSSAPRPRRLNGVFRGRMLYERIIDRGGV
jgi:hypothetical protein